LSIRKDLREANGIAMDSRAPEAILREHADDAFVLAVELALL